MAGYTVAFFRKQRLLNKSTLISASALTNADTANASVVSANTRFSFWICNVIGIVKVLTLIFISLTGLIVLGGHTRVSDPGANFRNAFDKLEGGTTAYGITNALYKIVFAYAGYTNAFNVVNEVKVSQPRRSRLGHAWSSSLKERDA